MIKTELNDLTGKRFGRLIVVKRAKDYIRKSGKKDTQWLCKCDCGNAKIVKTSNLRSKSVRSCGCYAKEISSKVHKKHGLTHTKLFEIWHGMRRRCLSKTHKNYKDYGGRGIKICSKWPDFKNFYDWALSNGYKKGLTIDRINVNGNYEPSNCRWATQKEQQNNRRNNVRITYQGQTMTLTQLAEKYNIKMATLRGRLNKGLDLEDALFIPVSRTNNFRKEGLING